jgi:hypothetical protein
MEAQLFWLQAERVVILIHGQVAEQQQPNPILPAELIL